MSNSRLISRILKTMVTTGPAGPIGPAGPMGPMGPAGSGGSGSGSPGYQAGDMMQFAYVPGETWAEANGGLIDGSVYYEYASRVGDMFGLTGSVAPPKNAALVSVFANSGNYAMPSFNHLDIAQPTYNERYAPFLEDGIYAYSVSAGQNISMAMPPAKTFEFFDKDMVFLLQCLNGTWSPDYCSMDIEFLDANDNVFFYIGSISRGDYRHDLKYGVNKTSSVLATGAGYHRANGDISFTNTSVSYTRDPAITDHYFNNWTADCNVLAIKKIRISNIRVESSYGGPGSAYVFLAMKENPNYVPASATLKRLPLQSTFPKTYINIGKKFVMADTYLQDTVLFVKAPISINKIADSGPLALVFDGPGTCTTSSAVKYLAKDSYSGSATIPSVTISTVEHTIEFWLYVDELSASGWQNGILQLGTAKDGDDGLLISVWTNGEIIFRNSYGNMLGSTIQMVARKWTHIATVLKNGKFFIYVDGVKSPTSLSYGGNINGAKKLTIGAADVSWQQIKQAYFANLRITNKALYEVGFTPDPNLDKIAPSVQYKDTYFDNVSLLMPFTGTNNSTQFIDLKGGSVSILQNAKISTVDKAFGTSSLRLDGLNSGEQYGGHGVIGKGLSIPDNANLRLDSGDFTIEMWFKNTGNTNYTRALISKRISTNPFGWNMYIDSNNKLVGSTYNSSSVETRIASSDIVTNDVWHHAAFVRSGSAFTLYLDGKSVGTFNSSGPLLHVANSPVVIGCYDNLSYPFMGNIQDIRITKDVARYTANFTPELKAFPSLTNNTMKFISTGAAPDVLIQDTGKTLIFTGTSGWYKASGDVSKVATQYPYFEVNIIELVNMTLAVGIAPTGIATFTYAGGSDNAGDGGRYQFFNTGQKRSGGTYVNYAGSFATGDTIGCTLRANGSNTDVIFYKNGTSLGVAFSLPGTNISYVPHICAYGSDVSSSAKLKFPDTIDLSVDNNGRWI